MILKKFKEEFPSKEKFYSSLMDREITDKEHEHVFNVWNKFEIKTKKDYRDWYFKCDILLLDVFKTFRSNSLKNYELCSAKPTISHVLCPKTRIQTHYILKRE